MDERKWMAEINMKAIIIQPYVSFSLEDNLKRMLESLDAAGQRKADMVILPELWTVPFINSEIAAHQNDASSVLDALSGSARKNGLWIIAGTIPYLKNGHLYNSCFVFNDQGEIVTRADKLHLLEVHTSKHDYYESEVFTPGNRLVRFDSPWGKIGIVICYDIRFPEVCRLLSEDCMMIAAVCSFNAPAGKKHWQPLMQTRAMENEVFVAAANPAAIDYPSYSGYGHSLFVSPDGQVLCHMDGEAGMLECEIDPEQVRKIRHRSPFWTLRRRDLYRLEACSPVLESENE